VPPEDPPPHSPPPALVATSVRRLLRPLVGLLMRSGVTFPVLADLLRSLYVEVALRDFLTDRRARTDSRASLLTGVHRKEVRRLRAVRLDDDASPKVLTRTSHILARWLGTPAFLDSEGRPRVLPRLAQDGSPVSFEALVESVTTDVRPRAVLDDWLSQGIVTLDAEGQVHLNVAGFFPRHGQEEQLFYFARNLHDHIAAAAENVLAAGSPPFLDRSVHYDKLSATVARRLEALAREVAQHALLEVNRAALAMLDAEDEPSGDPPPGPTHRVNLGIYVFTADEPASTTDAA
jgi:Family of unknown function (DUF6502)